MEKEPAVVFFSLMICFLLNNITGIQARALEPKDPNMIVGSTLNMTCSLKNKLREQGYTSAHIRFQIGDVLMPPNETQVLSNKKARLLHPNLEFKFNSKVVDCIVINEQNQTKVDSTYMHVGYPPHKASIVNAKVLNWEAIQFEWQAERNPVYSTTQRGLWKKQSDSVWTECILIETEEASCMVTRKDGYDPDTIIYHLMVNGSSNIAGVTLSEVFVLKANRYVEAASVGDLHVATADSRSITLSFTSPKPGRTLKYNCTYLSTWLKHGQLEDVVTSNESVHLVIRNLVPYTKYQFNVTAQYVESIYTSRAAYVTHNTTSDVPGEPPLVTTGGFEYRRTNSTHFDAVIFWNPPPLMSLHGRFSHYEITYIEPGLGQHRNSTTRTWIHIQNLLKKQHYDVVVYVFNDKGCHKTHGNTPLKAISIYPNAIEPPKDFNFTVIAVLNDVYLRWKSQLSAASVTVYWCKANSQLLQCQDDATLHWKKLPPTTDQHVVNISDTEHSMEFLFGISVEKKQDADRVGSTGILWSHCTYDSEKYYREADVSIKSEDSDSVSLSIRQPSCRETRAYVYAYRVILCPQKCNDTQASNNIERIVYSTEAEYFTIDGLTHDTDYTLRVLSLSAFKHQDLPYEHLITTRFDGRFPSLIWLLFGLLGIGLLVCVLVGSYAIYRWCKKRAHETIHMEIHTSTDYMDKIQHVHPNEAYDVSTVPVINVGFIQPHPKRPQPKDDPVKFSLQESGGGGEEGIHIQLPLRPDSEEEDDDDYVAADYSQGFTPIPSGQPHDIIVSDSGESDMLLSSMQMMRPHVEEEEDEEKVSQPQEPLLTVQLPDGLLAAATATGKHCAVEKRTPQQQEREDSDREEEDEDEQEDNYTSTMAFTQAFPDPAAEANPTQQQEEEEEEEEEEDERINAYSKFAVIPPLEQEQEDGQ